MAKQLSQLDETNKKREEANEILEEKELLQKEIETNVFYEIIRT